MQIQHPFRTVTASLDGDVLAVLARVEKPLTAPRIAELIDGYSLSGVRKSLHRLVEQGVVLEALVGRTRSYVLNLDHLAAHAIREFADLRAELILRIRRHVEEHLPDARFVAVFGSAARGEMRVDSDIDLLVVRDEGLNGDDWEQRLAEFAEAVRRWTGNVCDPVSFDADELEGKENEGMLKDVLRHGEVAVGSAGWLRHRLMRKERA